MKYKKNTKLRIIGIWLLCVFLLTGCAEQKNRDVRYYALREKLAVLDGYNQKLYTALKRHNINEVKLFYQQLRFVIPLNEKETIDVYVFKGIENIFAIHCYLNADSSDQVLTQLDLAMLREVVNAVSIDKIKAPELSEFINDRDGKYKVSSGEKLKKTEDRELSFYLVIDESYGSRLDINGTIRDDVDFYSFFALLEDIYKKWDYAIQPCEYGVNYQIKSGPDTHLEYGFYTYVYTDDTFIANDRFTLDYTNQLKDEKEALVNIDVGLFKDLVSPFSGVAISEEMLNDFLNDKTGKYDDGDQFFLISRTYNFYYDTNWDISYILSNFNSETLTYYGEIDS